MRNNLEASLMRLRKFLRQSDTHNRQALGRAREALAIIQELRVWIRRLGPSAPPRWGDALRAAERALTVFLRDATRVLDRAGDGGREPKTRQRSTTRGSEVLRDRG